MLHQSNNTLHAISSIKHNVLSQKTKAFILTIMFLAISVASISQHNSVSAATAYEEAGFADADLYECVINNYNSAFSTTKTTNDVLSNSELASIKELKCQYGGSSTDRKQYKIASTEGIQKMTGLESLRLSGTLFSSINLSANIKLKLLSLSYNFDLTNLDISHNTDLEEVYIFWFTKLANYFDFSVHPKIKEINIQTTDITGVNTDHNPLLERLILFGDDRITEIKTNNNPELKRISAYGTGITSIDISKNLKLDSIDLDNTKITSLNISNNKLLKTLDIYSTQLSDINLSENPLLEYIRCSKTNIKAIDIRKNPQVSTLNVPTGASILASVEGWYDEDGSLIAELSKHAGFIKKVEASNEYQYLESTKRLYITNPKSREVTLNIDASPAFGNTVTDDRAVLKLEIQVPGSNDEPNHNDEPNSQDEPGSTDDPSPEKESDIKVPNTGTSTAVNNGVIVVASLAAILTASVIIYLSRYVIKRQRSKVSFK